MVNPALTSILFPPSPILPYIPKISFLNPRQLGVPGRCCTSPPHSVLCRSRHHQCHPPLLLPRIPPSRLARLGRRPRDHTPQEMIPTWTNRMLAPPQHQI